MSECLFCKIRDGEIPCDKLYEDDDVIAFRDVNPQAPSHFLVIPRKHIATANDLAAEDQAVAGKIMLVARRSPPRRGSIRTATDW